MVCFQTNKPDDDDIKMSSKRRIRL